MTIEREKMREETLKQEDLLRPKAGAGVPEPGLNRRSDKPKTRGRT
jgi:hypothetical protein